MTLLSRGAAAALLAIAFGLSACARSESRPPPHPPVPAAHVAAKKPNTDHSATQDLALRGQNSVFTMPDHQHPQWLACKLLLQQLLFTADNNVIKGHGATAVLFSQGKQSGVMTAPMATGYITTETVRADGGVHMASVDAAGHETGRFLDADTVVWNAKTQLGKAYGHVHYRDTKSGMKGIAPILYFNSSLKTIQTTPLLAGR